MKKLITILLIFSTLFLSSCDKVITIKEDRQNGLLLVENFCYTLSNDIEMAKEYLHPISAPNKDRLEEFVIKLENIHDINFSNGITMVNSQALGFSIYDGSYYGSAYFFEVELIVSNKTVVMSFVVVDNDQGYGIHSFSIIE